MSLLSRIRALTTPAPLDDGMAQAMRDSVHHELDEPFELRDTPMGRNVLEQHLALVGPRVAPVVKPDMLERELRSEFEIWVLANLEALDAAGVLSHEHVLTRRTNGDYLSSTVRGAWMGFRHGRLG